MIVPHADALVFFGATGDLAYKKIFPALQAMAKRGHLNVPVIGVAKAGWSLDQLRARERRSSMTPYRPMLVVGYVTQARSHTYCPPVIPSPRRNIGVKRSQ